MFWRRSFRRALVATAMMSLAGVSPELWALDPPNDEGMARLARLVIPEEASRINPAAHLYRTLYALWDVTRAGMTPSDALAEAAQSVRRPLPEPCHRQLLADWRVACDYGLLTPENLERMQEGLAPTATAGHFAGVRMDAILLKMPGGSGVPNDLSGVALRPAGNPPPPGAIANGAVTLSSAVRAGPAGSWTQATARTFPPGRAQLWGVAPGANRFSPPTPATPVAAFPLATPPIRPERIEVHDTVVNGALPLGGGRRLAVASDRGTVVSVSVIGDGPKVRRTSPGSGTGPGSKPASTVYYDKVDNTRVPKVNPVHLPGISGNAYLIHSDGTGRYYYVDTVVNNGGAFRIAKVVTSP